MRTHLTVRLSPEAIAKLGELSATLGLTSARAIDRAILDWTPGAEPKHRPKPTTDQKLDPKKPAPGTIWARVGGEEECQ